MQEIGSIKKAASILNLFTQGYPELGPTEISVMLGMNKSTVIRLINTLVSVGLMRKTPRRGKYCLGRQIMSLAYASSKDTELESVCLPYLQQLRDETGETISLDIIEGDKRQCILIVEGNYPIKLGAKVKGEYATLHAGSDSKLLLAFLPDEEIDRILQKTELTRYTKHTITNINTLKKEIENIRKKDYSISKEERWEYAFCISAPVRNYTGNVIAALSVFGVVFRLTPEREKELVKHLSRTADEISVQLGYWGK